MSCERETSSTSTNIDLYVPTQTERKISSADFPSLLLTERETGRVTTAERETVVGERVVTHRTRLVVDEDTGQETFETVQLVEKTIEHEVQIFDDKRLLSFAICPAQRVLCSHLGNGYFCTTFQCITLRSTRLSL